MNSQKKMIKTIVFDTEYLIYLYLFMIKRSFGGRRTRHELFSLVPTDSSDQRQSYNRWEL